MTRILIAVALAAGLACASTTPASAATRNYDCSKPGNANKAACKTSKAPAAKAAPKAAPTATRTTTTTNKTTTTSRTYDCTKAGNANKAACKTAAAQTPGSKAAGAVKTTTKTTATTIDCTKLYNKMRAQCRKSSSSTPAQTTVAPAPKPVAASTGSTPKASGKSVNNNPAGATAQCKDGSYSHAKTHQGACSRHGGVAKWL
jgi:hypothetical protein